MLGFSGAGIAQNYNTVYLDAMFKEISDPEEAEYYREVSASESGLFMVDVYYNPSGKIKMTGSYSDEELKKEEGLFTYYHTNGQVESKGMYSEGVKYGIWERFYWDGGKKEDKFYSGETVDSMVNTRFSSTCAQFPGGESEMTKFIMEEMQYPEAALHQSLEGEVHIAFVVGEDGALKNPSIVKSAHYYLDKEAERIVRSMPRWIPASKSGFTVQSNFVLPIQFSLAEK